MTALMFPGKDGRYVYEGDKASLIKISHTRELAFEGMKDEEEREEAIAAERAAQYSLGDDAEEASGYGIVYRRARHPGSLREGR